MIVRCIVVIALVLAAGAGVRQQPRDISRVTAGTGSISGVVLVDGDPNRPARRTRVTLAEVTRTVPGRTTTTDDRGMFAFRSLPAGRFELQAFKNAYLRVSYGATRPDRTGTPIVIRDGEAVTNLAMSIVRGGVITGSVHDGRDRPVPGVMGSLLSSRTKGGVWWIDARTARHIDDLGLSPDGTTDRDPDNEVSPFSTDPVYEPFLAAVLARDDFGHISFPYDWRKSLRHSADAFRDVVRDCYGRNRGPVHVVAHSMGGLAVRVGLMIHGAELWPKIDRIVFIGTPHFGSPAIAGYLKNHLWGFEILTLLGRLLSRRSFRSFRGVLGLLPAPFGIYPGTRPGDRVPMHDTLVAGHPCANFEMYRAREWDLGLDKEDDRQLQGVLDSAAALHRDLLDAHSSLTSAQRKKILVIAGVGYKTLFRLEYPTGMLRSWKRMIKVVDRVAGDANREGDGRVPLASALLEGVAIRYVRGVHASLPNIPVVYDDVFRWLKGESLELPKTPAEALAKHLGTSSTSVAPSLDGTSRASVHSDDPGYLVFDPPTDETLAQYRLQLETGTLPAFNHSARIF